MPNLQYHRRSRTKGSRQPLNTLYCGRPSRYGNEFTGPGAADRYRAQLLAEIAVDPQAGALMVKRLRRYSFLSCWCAVGGDCHVQGVLLELANG